MGAPPGKGKVGPPLQRAHLFNTDSRRGDRFGARLAPSASERFFDPSLALGAGGGSLADVRHQRHEARSLHSVLDRALKRGAVAAALAAEHLALTGAELLERLHVLVVDEGRPRAAFLGAEAAAILAAAPEFLANHPLPSPGLRAR